GCPAPPRPTEGALSGKCSATGGRRWCRGQDSNLRSTKHSDL
ncbi:uncharacterized protein METZ01_LOCUS201607, partial [marine metagenome]